jgi:hypothetical protein
MQIYYFTFPKRKPCVKVYYDIQKPFLLLLGIKVKELTLLKHKTDIYTPSVPKYKALESSNSRNNSESK